MATAMVIAAGLLLWLPGSVFGQEPMDFIKVIAADSALSRQVGLHKLTQAERTAWNELLNRVYAYALSGTAQQESGTQPGSASVPPTTGTAYVTKIEEDIDDVLKLANGGIVEVTSGFLGFLGFRKDCVLFKAGTRWRIWIDGKRTFTCQVLKEPTVYRKQSAELLYISRVYGDGKILEMGDGRMYEVDDLYLIYTGLWLGGAEALLIDGYQLLNLDAGDELIGVTVISR